MITFTNEAAKEMENRLSFTPAFIGTIHRFAYELILELSEKHGFRVSLMREYQLKDLIYKIANDHDFPMQEVDTLYNYLTNQNYFVANNPIIPSYYRKLEKYYKNFKKETGIYDLTDSPLYLLKKIEQYGINLDYEYLFVDEAQDLSPDQYELINKLPIPNKFIIGDPLQSIYMFRGADGFVFEKFIKNNYKQYILNKNYRSYQEILDYAGAPLVAAKGSGGKIFEDCDEAIQTSPRILCRSNQEVQKIQKIYDNVSTIHAAKGLEYDNVIVIPFDLNNDEEKNIYYVALTRAKNGIGVFSLKEVLRSIKKNKK